MRKKTEKIIGKRLAANNTIKLMFGDPDKSRAVKDIALEIQSRKERDVWATA